MSEIDDLRTIVADLRAQLEESGRLHREDRGDIASLRADVDDLKTLVTDVLGLKPRAAGDPAPDNDRQIADLRWTVGMLRNEIIFAKADITRTLGEILELLRDKT